MNAVIPDSFFGRIGGIYCAATRQIDRLQPLLLLAFRLYVARVFFSFPNTVPLKQVTATRPFIGSAFAGPLRIVLPAPVQQP